MRPEDISFAIQITDQENWSIPLQDFQRILRLDPRGSFIATEGKRRIGLATTASYGRKIAWIGNVVVKKQYRGKHVGQLLVTNAVNYLHEKRVKHVALYCFDENVEFYKNLGFLKGTRFGRMRRELHPISEEPRKFDSYRSLALPEILTLDEKAFGADRSSVILDLLRSKAASVLSVARGQARSYLLTKDYEDMYELGPWTSVQVSRPALEYLLSQSLARANRKAVEVSAPLRNVQAIAMLRRNDFRITKTGRSMFLDEIPRIGSPATILALGFLDKG
jgi:ribosomal protein S18 acetylase RimI-like enzyme